MNKTMKRFANYAALLLVAVSCDGSLLLPFAGEVVDIEGNAVEHGMIVLGSRLEDPYSIENISKAVASLYPTRSDRVVMDPTDMYIRFLPADENEYDELEAAGITMLDHPVNYEILREGDYYHDPGVPEGRITWQYTVIGIDEPYPEHIEHEILDYCYIPEHAPSSKADDGMDWASVEREAFRLTGNAGMLAPDTRASGSASPSGRITILDEKCSETPEGLKGVRVSCNSFVKFANAYTDEDGNYSMDKSFSSNPRYRIVYKNKLGFAIGFNLVLIPSSYSTLGKNAPSGLDFNISSSSDRKLFTRSAVNNAAYDYYKKCAEEGGSMKTPPSNLRIWLFQNLRRSSAVMMQQGVLVDEGLIADYLGEYTFLLKMFLPDVTIGLKDINDFAGIYSLTVHELAHASHFMQAGKDYWNRYAKFIMKSFVSSGFVTYGTGAEDDHGYCEVGEMWAYYVQNLYYNSRYGDSDTVFGTGYWFYPQLFMYLDERGLGKFKIYAALTSDIYDRTMLQKKLTSLYPQFKSAITQAFVRYN